MQRGPEGTKYCHLIWATRNGRSWFKIAAAALFCERAVRHACTTLGWRAEVVVIFPSRIQVLVAVPSGEDRRTISPRLQRATSRLLHDGRVLPELEGSLWAGDGWCAVLPNAVSAAAVRRVLREKVAAYSAGSETEPVRDDR